MLDEVGGSQNRLVLLGGVELDIRRADISA